MEVGDKQRLTGRSAGQAEGSGETGYLVATDGLVLRRRGKSSSSHIPAWVVVHGGEKGRIGAGGGGPSYAVFVFLTKHRIPKAALLFCCQAHGSQGERQAYQELNLNFKPNP